MTRTRTALAALVTAAAAVATVGTGAASAQAAVGTAGAAHGHRGPECVRVTATDGGVRVDHRWVHAGAVSFHVATSTSSGDSEVALFRPTSRGGVARVLADLREEFSDKPATAAKGTRDLTRDARFYGLADVAKGRPVTVTEVLQAGRYYLMDVGAAQKGAAPTLTAIDVVGSVDRHAWLGPVSGKISMTSSDRFVAPHRLPRRGSLLVRNIADTLHFAVLQPVKPGTTDAQVAAYFASGSQQPPSFALPGPSEGSDVLSPGHQLRLTYDLPAGTYVLLCFVADDRTGMPHAMMGMHKVVVLH